MALENDVVWRARRVVLPSGTVAADIGVVGERIAAVGAFGELAGAEVVAFGDDVVLLPGLVDSHVHVNEPGRTHWEGFETATRAARAGGITTLVDMPLNSIPATVDVAALEVKRRAADGKLAMDVGFWGGAVPGNVAELAPLAAEGVFGFKCFLAPSGVDEFGHLSPADLDEVLVETARLGALLIVHAEDAQVLLDAAHAGGRAYGDFVASRPDLAEEHAVAALVRGAARTGARVHVLHVSSATVLEVLRTARAEGVAVTAETCPHYLTLLAEDVADGATAFKCCPPIRSQSNQDLLWQALADGVIDIVVSDHSPSPIPLKRLDSGDFAQAWGGISSLQLSLSAVWTHARRRGHTLDDVARWMSSGPALVTGLEQKGRLAVGADADLCVLADAETWVVDQEALLHRNPLTPYDGQELAGVVRETWLRGARGGAGRMLVRGAG